MGHPSSMTSGSSPLPTASSPFFGFLHPFCSYNHHHLYRRRICRHCHHHRHHHHHCRRRRHRHRHYQLHHFYYFFLRLQNIIFNSLLMNTNQHIRTSVLVNFLQPLHEIPTSTLSLFCAPRTLTHKNAAVVVGDHNLVARDSWEQVFSISELFLHPMFNLSSHHNDDYYFDDVFNNPFMIFWAFKGY